MTPLEYGRAMEAKALQMFAQSPNVPGFGEVSELEVPDFGEVVVQIPHSGQYDILPRRLRASMRGSRTNYTIRSAWDDGSDSTFIVWDDLSDSKEAMEHERLQQLFRDADTSRRAEKVRQATLWKSWMQEQNVCPLQHIHEQWQGELKRMELYVEKEPNAEALLFHVDLDSVISAHDSIPENCTCRVGPAQWARVVDLVVSVDRRCKQLGHYPYERSTLYEKWIVGQRKNAYSIRHVHDSPFKRKPWFVSEDPYIIHLSTVEVEPCPDNDQRWKESHVRALEHELRITRQEALDKLNEKKGNLMEASVSLRFDLSRQYDKESCSICLDLIQGWEGRPRHLLCGHFFHPVCIDRWLKQSPTCPNCRKPVNE